MNLTDPTTQTTTTINPKTPSGAYGDPVQVGQMIQQMYPQYKNFDAATIGQRWIDLHTPKATGGANDLVLAPGTSVTSTTPSTPDLSGLGKYATPVKEQPKPVSLTQGLQALTPNMTSLTQGGTPGYMLGGDNTLYSAPQVQPKPQKPQPLSTFDISKVRF